MVDDQLQAGMRLGDLPEGRQEQAGHGGDGDAFLLGGGPHPVELALVQGLLLVGIEQRPAQAHHPGLVAPAVDALAAFRIVERELAHHGEAVGISLRGGQRHLL